MQVLPAAWGVTNTPLVPHFIKSKCGLCLDKAHVTVQAAEEGESPPAADTSHSSLVTSTTSSLPSAFKTSVRSKRKVEETALWVPALFRCS